MLSGWNAEIRMTRLERLAKFVDSVTAPPPGPPQEARSNINSRKLSRKIFADPSCIGCGRTSLTRTNHGGNIACNDLQHKVDYVLCICVQMSVIPPSTKAPRLD